MRRAVARGAGARWWPSSRGRPRVGQAAPEPERAAAAPLTSEEGHAAAEAEELTLRVADNKTGYFGMILDQRDALRYQTQV